MTETARRYLAILGYVMPKGRTIDAAFQENA
jgi:hypothetical protein